VAAKRRGVKFGRPICEAPGNFGEIVRRWEKNEISLNEALEQCHMSRATFYRRLYEFQLLKKAGK